LSIDASAAVILHLAGVGATGSHLVTSVALVLGASGRRVQLEGVLRELRLDVVAGEEGHVDTT